MPNSSRDTSRFIRNFGAANGDELAAIAEQIAIENPDMSFLEVAQRSFAQCGSYQARVNQGIAMNRRPARSNPQLDDCTE